MTNSNSPYQSPLGKDQPQNPGFTPSPNTFQTPQQNLAQANPYLNNGNPYAGTNPYQNAPQQGEYSLPPELNPRDKEEYFRMWRGFSYIPRPAIIWWGGLLASLIICSSVSWSDILYDLFNSIFSTAWLVFGIVGTISFKQGVKQIFVFYPHLARSEQKMIEMRKIARLKVGYTYKDTFSHMWKSMATLFTGIFTSSPAVNNGAGYPAPNNASGAQPPVPPIVPVDYNASPYGAPSPYGSATSETTTPTNNGQSSDGHQVNLNKENS